MKWVAIGGGWRKTNSKLENDVRKTVKEIISRGDGIISGGAPGVDYFAVDEALKHNLGAERIKIFLPTSLKFYIQHTKSRAEQGVLDKDSAEAVIKQLVAIQKTSPSSIIEGKDVEGNKHVEKRQYYERNSLIISAADELIAFHVNESKGTKDAIDKAKAMKIPLKIFSYTID